MILIIVIAYLVFGLLFSFGCYKGDTDEYVTLNKLTIFRVILLSPAWPFILGQMITTMYYESQLAHRYSKKCLEKQLKDNELILNSLNEILERSNNGEL